MRYGLLLLLLSGCYDGYYGDYGDGYPYYGYGGGHVYPGYGYPGYLGWVSGGPPGRPPRPPEFGLLPGPPGLGGLTGPRFGGPPDRPPGSVGLPGAAGFRGFGSQLPGEFHGGPAGGFGGGHPADLAVATLLDSAVGASVDLAARILVSTPANDRNEGAVMHRPRARTLKCGPAFNSAQPA